MLGRGESWRVDLPSVALMQAHEQPFCKCCHQRLRLAEFAPSFMYCVGENTGYDPCHPNEVLKRWDTEQFGIPAMISDKWEDCNGQYYHLPKSCAELVLWAFGYAVRPGMEATVLQQAKDWLQRAQTSCVLGWRQKDGPRFTEFRLAYAEWTLKRIKIRLREMKRAGEIAKTACVR